MHEKSRPARRRIAALLAAAMALSLMPLSSVTAASAAGSVRTDPRVSAKLAQMRQPTGDALAARPTPAAKRVVVRWAPGVPAAQRDAAAARLGFRIVRTDRALGRSLVEPTRKGQSAAALADTLNAAHLTITAEPEVMYSILATTPSDPLFGQQWALHNTGQTGGTPGADIKAPEAWSRGAGSSSIVVAVVDEGMDVDHPDLKANIWTNRGEIPGNGIDDDHNGYVDDVHGYDFYNMDASVYDPQDGDRHGTHVAGIIGAVGDNGVGISGVNQSVTIMPVKFLGPWGGGDFEGAQAIRYAVDNGADVINCSWGGGDSELIDRAIDYAAAHDVLVVCAAGNGASSNDDPMWASYPASYDSTAVVSVAASDDKDKLADFSSYGAESVDLAAPGVDVTSTLPWETVGLYVDKLPYKVMYLAFPAEAIDPPATRVAIIGRSMAKLAPTDAPVLVVDDSLPTLTKETPGARLGKYLGALSAAGYTNVSTWSTENQGTPALSDLLGRTVVWFTGASTFAWYNEPTLNDAERGVIGSYLDNGGRMLLSSGDLGLDMEYFGLDPEWYETYMHAGFVDYQTWSRAWRGTPDGPFDSLTGEIPAAYFDLPTDFIVTQSLWPTGSDSIVPLDEYATSVAQMGGYGALSGTSMATPHVTGAAALLMSQMPGATAEDIRARIENNVDPKAAFDGKTVYGGRLDIDAATHTYPGRPLSLEPTSGAGWLKTGRTMTVKWRTAPGSSSDATGEVQQGLPYALLDTGFESASIPASFTTPAGALPFEITTAPALVHSGTYAMRNAPFVPTGHLTSIGGGWFEITGLTTSSAEAALDVPDGGGTMSFWWSMETFDADCILVVDGQWVDMAFGLDPWRKVQVDLPAGHHTVGWMFERRPGFSYGLDAVGVDDVKLTAHAFSTVATTAAGVRETSWTVPSADTGDGWIRARTHAEGRTSPWTYTKGLRISSDLTAPGAPRAFTVGTGNDGDVHLNWLPPTDPDFASARVLQRIGTPPTGPDDASATVVYEGTSTAAAEYGLRNGNRAYYAAYAFDGANNVSQAAVGQALVIDTVAPAAPRPLDAEMQDGLVGLSWMRSAPQSPGTVKVVRRTGTPPAGPDDPAATLVYDGSSAYAFDYRLSQMATQTTAYYLAVATDPSGNSSAASRASIALDTRGPRGSITAGGTNHRVTSVTTTVTMDVIRAVDMRFNGGSGWSDWRPYATTALVSMLPVEGDQTILGQFRDSGGVIKELTANVYVNLGAPRAPATLRAMPWNDKVKLVWDANSEGDLKSYKVYRSPTATGALTYVGTLPASAASQDPFGGVYWDVTDLGLGAAQTPADVTDPSEDPTLGMPDEPTVETPTAEYYVGKLTKGKTYFFSVVAVDQDGYESTRSVPASASPGPGIKRRSGVDRYTTSVAVSRAHFATATAAVLVSGDKPLEMIPAAGLAGSYGGPLLLTARTSVPSAVKTELRRLGVSQVLVVGGTSSVTNGALASLDASITVRRIAGPDSYTTAGLVAQAMAANESTGFAKEAFLVSVRTPIDALGAMSIAYSRHMPILLTDKTRLPSATYATIDDLDLSRLYVIGSTTTIPKATLKKLSWVPQQRVYGFDRYESANDLADLAVNSGWASYESIGVANGAAFADSVSGAAALGRVGGVLQLSGRGSLGFMTQQNLAMHKTEVDKVEVYGGGAAVGGSVVRQLTSVFSWSPPREMPPLPDWLLEEMGLL